VPTSSLIAIVDDDDSFRVALESFVRSLGYRAQGFASAEALLQSGKAAEADCIVTDIHMPGIGGIALTRELDSLGCTAPVILLTGRTGPGIRREAQESGAHCFLLKPFDPQAMADCLARAVAA